MRFSRRRVLAASRAAGKLFLFLCIATWLAPRGHARAYAWMVRHGEAQCASCHADPSGGELLTRYGRAKGIGLMPMTYGAGRAEDAAGAKPRSGFLWGAWDTPGWLLLGGALRGAGFVQDELRVFPMQLDAYAQVKAGRFRAGGSLGVAKVEQNSPNARAAFVTRNQGDSLNLISRTHWLALDLGRRRDWTLRAGRMNLPFGLRVPEHYLWVRDVTRTDRDSDQQHGVALAYSSRTWRTEGMAIAGNYQLRPDRYRERGYSAYVERIFADHVGVGVSSLLTVAKADRVSFEQGDTTRGVHGAFARARVVAPLVLMGEVDVMHVSRRALGYVGFVQGDYEFIRGLHAIVTAEVLDQGVHDAAPVGVRYADVAGAGKPRAGGWLSADWFFYAQLDLRVDVVFRQDAGAYVLAQLHAYL